MKSKKEFPRPPSWLDVLAAVDHDKSETVTLKEIHHYIKNIVKKIEKEHGKIPKADKDALEAAFKHCDKDKNGHIDKMEYETAVAQMSGLAQQHTILQSMIWDRVKMWKGY